jgi:cytochrome c
MRFVALGLTIIVIGTAASMLVAAKPAPVDLAYGQQLFKAQCSICHATVAAKNGVGPSLAGAYGRLAAGAPGYAYSPAMKASKGKWDAAKLDKLLTDPRKAVPGTKMVFAGQPDPAKRAALIAYLATVK